MGLGFILLFRKIRDTSFYKDPVASRIAFHCLLSANHSNAVIMFNGEEIDIKRGQFITSFKRLADALDLSIRNIRTGLSRLECDGFLTVEKNDENSSSRARDTDTTPPQKATRQPTRKHTIITVCKYSTYQKNTKSSDTTADTRGPKKRHERVTTNNNDYLRNNDKKQRACARDNITKSDNNLNNNEPFAYIPEKSLSAMLKDELQRLNQ